MEDYEEEEEMPTYLQELGGHAPSEHPNNEMFDGTDDDDDFFGDTIENNNPSAIQTPILPQNRGLVRGAVTATTAVAPRPAFAVVKRRGADDKVPKKATPTFQVTNELDQKEEFSSIELKDRRVSRNLMSERMKGKTFVPLKKLSTFKPGVSENWVAVGCVFQVGVLKSSEHTGKKFYTVKLSDLDSGKVPGEARLCLYGSELISMRNELVEGVVVAVLNSKIAPRNPSFEKDFGDKKKLDEFAPLISVYSDSQLSILGRAKYFARCQAITKSNNRCTNAVNSQSGVLHCHYHVTRAFRVAANSRQDVSSGMGANSNVMTRNGKIQSSSPLRNKKKDMSTFTEKVMNHDKPKPNIPIAKPTRGGTMAGLVAPQKVLKNQKEISERNVKMREQLALAAREHEVGKKQSISVGNRCALAPTRPDKVKKDLKKVEALRGNIPAPDPNSTAPKQVGISREMLDARKRQEEERKKRKLMDDSLQEHLASERKSKIIRTAATTAKDNVQLTSSGSRKVAAAQLYKPKNGQEQLLAKMTAKKLGKAVEELTKNDVEAATSVIVHKDKMDDGVDEFLSKEEYREAVIEKAQQVTERKAVVWLCKTCSKRTRLFPVKCHDEKHVVVKEEGKERYFRCRACNYHLTTIDKHPKTGCPKCNKTDWKRDNQVKKSYEVTQMAPKLLPRGEELGKFRGSTGTHRLATEEEFSMDFE